MLVQNRANVKHVDLESLQLRPACFTAHLQEKFGFRLLEERIPGTSKMGFDRPLLWFKRVA